MLHSLFQNFFRSANFDPPVAFPINETDDFILVVVAGGAHVGRLQHAFIVLVLIGVVPIQGHKIDDIFGVTAADLLNQVDFETEPRFFFVL